MIGDVYNIYIDIDSILDFRLRVLEILGFDYSYIDANNAWTTRLSDSIFGVENKFIYSIIDTEMDAMFRSCYRTDIANLLYRVYMDGYAQGISNGKDIVINIDVDIKDIHLDSKSLVTLGNSIKSILPGTANINIVNTLVMDQYGSLIIYNSSKLIENIIALDKDYTGKKLYTPFLLDTLVGGIKPSVVMNELIEGLSGYIDLDYPGIECFSKKK